MALTTTEQHDSLLNAVRCIPVAQVYDVLHTSSDGLKSEEVQARLQQYGSNTIREIKGSPLIIKFFANFTHVMALLLWVGGVIAILARMPQLAMAIWAVNLINGVFSFWQEYRAEKATEALRRMLPIQVRVIRDKQEQRISAEELVPGDVIVIEEGDRVSADSRLIQATELQVDQSALTGESVPVRKLTDPILTNSLATAEISNLIFAGTHIVGGTGRAVVFATAMQTEFGKIASLTQTMDEAPSPLQKEMVVVTRIVTLIAVGIGAVFFILSVFLWIDENRDR
jgi:magnesium-transporting ATPase (P-type)